MPRRAGAGRVIAGCVTIGFALLATACGSETTESTTPTTTVATSTESTAAAPDGSPTEFRECLEQHGAQLPSDMPEPPAGDRPNGPPGGPPPGGMPPGGTPPSGHPQPPDLPEGQAEAFEACASLAPAPPGN
ncbi:hypothetical protein ACWCPQ_09825 [Nocardia sp. NPDC001965]